MLGRVTIYVDSERVTSFVDDLEQWENRREFRITRPPPIPLSIETTPELLVTPIKTITLKTVAILHGTILGQSYLCLFYYNYDNPTEKQMDLDVNIARGQMRNML